MTTQQTADWNDLWLKYHDINEKKVRNLFRILTWTGSRPDKNPRCRMRLRRNP